MGEGEGEGETPASSTVELSETEFAQKSKSPPAALRGLLAARQAAGDEASPATGRERV